MACDSCHTHCQWPYEDPDCYCGEDDLVFFVAVVGPGPSTRPRKQRMCPACRGLKHEAIVATPEQRAHWREVGIAAVRTAQAFGHRVWPTGLPLPPFDTGEADTLICRCGDRLHLKFGETPTATGAAIALPCKAR